MLSRRRRTRPHAPTPPARPAAALLAATDVLRSRVGAGKAVIGPLMSAGIADGFIQSRSVGVPGVHESDWELSGVVSVLLEGGFVSALGWHTRAAAQRASRRRALA